MQVNSKARHTTKKKPHDAILKQFINLPGSSVGKESACNAGDPGLIPGLGRSTAEGIGYPLQYSWASLLAQLVKNPLQCGRPEFDPWVGKIPWRRERLPTPVFWPGEFHGLYPWARKESDEIERLSLYFYIGVEVIIIDGRKKSSPKCKPL